MTPSQLLHRRTLLGGGLGAVPLLVAGQVHAAWTRPAAPASTTSDNSVAASCFGIAPRSDRDRYRRIIGSFIGSGRRRTSD